MGRLNMKTININNKEYEVYLSSNGIMRIEDLLGVPLQGLNLNVLGFKSMIILLNGILYQNNKLTLEDTADLFDTYISEGHSMNELTEIIKVEIGNWSGRLSKKNDNDELGKKK
jgi:hypothetical protein